MKRFLIAAISSLALALAPALGATIAVTQGTGTNMGVAQDGSSNNIPAGVICGATSSATLYATCANQAIVDATGQLHTQAVGSGTAGTPSGGVMTVQGASSMTALAISAASGAVASGAYASGSLASGAGTDGWNVTEGTKADSAYAGSGSASIVAILKGLYSAYTSAIPAGTNVIGYTTNDPCGQAAKVTLAISTNATSLTQIVAASGSTKIYICSIAIIAAGATAFNLNTGTGSNCASSTAAVMGSTTAANGMSFAANGGLTLGSGNSTVAEANLAGGEICTLQSNAVYVSGSMTYVQQ